MTPVFVASDYTYRTHLVGCVTEQESLVSSPAVILHQHTLTISPWGIISMDLLNKFDNASGVVKYESHTNNTKHDRLLFIMFGRVQ